MWNVEPSHPRFFFLQQDPKSMASGTWLQFWNVAILWWSDSDMTRPLGSFRRISAVFVVENALKRTLSPKRRSLMVARVSPTNLWEGLRYSTPHDVWRILGLDMATPFFILKAPFCSNPSDKGINKKRIFSFVLFFRQSIDGPRPRAIQPIEMNKILQYVY